MPAITGVATRKNKHRKLTHIIIDVRKHPEAIIALKELGLVKKTQFEKDCEDTITVEQLRDSMFATIKNFYADKH